MGMKMQTEGFFVIGELPNLEHYCCLVCRDVPDRVHVDLFVPEPRDIPESIASRVPKTLAVPYRLCPHCYRAKSNRWRIRLLVLEKLNAMMEAL